MRHSLTRIILIHAMISRKQPCKSTMLRSLDSAIGKLTAGQREAVTHLAVRSQSLAQAATATGRSTGSLRVDWHRALKTLRAQFDRKD